MADRPSVSELLSSVIDPLLERPLGDLNMLGEFERRRLGAESQERQRRLDQDGGGQ